MSASNPIIPPGSPLQRTLPGRNPKLVVTVFAILAVHVLLLSGLLIQGCKREDKNATGTADTFTNSTASLPPLPAANSPGPEVARTPPPTDSGSLGTQRPTAVPTFPTAPAESTGTVVVATEPSPTMTLPKVEPTTPAPHVQAPAHHATSPLPGDGTVTVYTVKAGDNLTKIAKAHGTTAKAIREASGLKTDRILVGQKLKVPQGTVAAATPTPPSTVGTK